MNVKDDVWRKLMRDVKFRRALSLAINRHEINQVIYYGLALVGQNTVLPQSPLLQKNTVTPGQFDLKHANELLDGLGLTERICAVFACCPDGRPMEIIVETAGEDTEQTDVLELIHDSWLAAGIKLFTRPSQREVFRNRIFAGETLVRSGRDRIHSPTQIPFRTSSRPPTSCSCNGRNGDSFSRPGAGRRGLPTVTHSNC